MLKPGATAFQLVDVPQLLADVLVLVHAQLVERNVVVMERFPELLPTVYGDRIQLQQVLLNLLMNACEAMRDNAPHDRTLLVAASQDSTFVTVSVTDCGSGLAPDVAERLFEAFFTTKADGLGLGLSICRSIVTLHNGRISARNNADRGATVDLVLPVAQVEPQASPKPGGPLRSGQALEGRVLHARRVS